MKSFFDKNKPKDKPKQNKIPIESIDPNEYWVCMQTNSNTLHILKSKKLRLKTLCGIELPHGFALHGNPKIAKQYDQCQKCFSLIKKGDNNDSTNNHGNNSIDNSLHNDENTIKKKRRRRHKSS